MRLKQIPRNKKEEHRRIAEMLSQDKNNKQAARSAEMEIEMSKTTKTVIIAVVVTLVAIGSLVGSFIGGMHYQESINNRVLTEANEIVKLKQ